MLRRSFPRWFPNKMNQSLWNAFWEVKRGDVKANEATQQNGVARSTLYRRLKNPLPRPVGRPFSFEDYDANILATLLRGFAILHLSVCDPVYFRKYRSIVYLRR